MDISSSSLICYLGMPYDYDNSLNFAKKKKIHFQTSLSELVFLKLGLSLVLTVDLQNNFTGVFPLPSLLLLRHTTIEKMLQFFIRQKI